VFADHLLEEVPTLYGPIKDLGKAYLQLPQAEAMVEIRSPDSLV